MPVSYNLVRTARKTISISVTEQAQVIVRAPLKLSQEKIDKYVLQNELWVQKHVQKAKIRQSQITYATFEKGSYLYFLGKKIEIEFLPLNGKAIEVEDKILINEKYSKNAKKVILAWYKRTAKNTIEKRITSICAENDIKIEKVRISNAQTRWGSCSGKNNISISWRLIMAPPSVLDYVIYHELAHVKHKNHSKSFWNHVYMFDKHYRMSEKWLKENGHL
nr:M48 family metallopeptidase [Patescibacteria group bacterium]